MPRFPLGLTRVFDQVKIRFGFQCTLDRGSTDTTHDTVMVAFQKNLKTDSDQASTSEISVGERSTIRKFADILPCQELQASHETAANNEEHKSVNSDYFIWALGRSQLNDDDVVMPSFTATQSALQPPNRFNKTAESVAPILPHKATDNRYRQYLHCNGQLSRREFYWNTAEIQRLEDQLWE